MAYVNMELNSIFTRYLVSYCIYVLNIDNIKDKKGLLKFVELVLEFLI